MPLPSLRKIISGLTQLGIGTSLAALQHTRLKKEADQAYQDSLPEEKELEIGNAMDAHALPHGARFQFENASLEITLLAEDLIRVSWGPGEDPLPYSLAKTEWAGEPARLQKNRDGWALHGSKVSISVDRTGRIRYISKDGKLWREEFTPVRKGQGWNQQVRLGEDEAIYGLGERNGKLNKRGRSYQMWNRQAPLHYSSDADPLYLCVTASLSVSRNGGYLVYYENPYPGSFDLDSAGDCRALISFEAGKLQYYLIPGDPQQAIARFSELTGRAPLPPRWALGYQQSRWGYMNEKDILRVVEGFARHDIPLSAIHLDIDYMRGYRVFSVNKKRFPDLKGLAKKLNARGIQMVTIIDPAVKKDTHYDVYQSGIEKEAFCKQPDGQVYHGVVWPGWAAFPDFTSPEVRQWWGGWYQRLAEWGVSGIWHDMNEPTSFGADFEMDMTLPLSTRHSLEGTGGDHREAHNLYALLMNRAGFVAWRKLQPEKRPWILSRSGCAGLQRYAWNWTGDIEASWDFLRQTIPTVLNLGMSGIPFTGPDASGYFGNPSPELYIRWMQMAAFLPLFRGHSAKTFTAREPWNFGDKALEIAREFILLRYRLMPYLYTAARQTCEKGHPMVRPLFWDHPDDPHLRDIDDSFLLGEDLLIAPVVNEGEITRKVRLPEGRWYSFWDGKGVSGPGWVEMNALLESIPVLARGGSLIPMANGNDLDLHAYGPGPWKCSLYSDAGDGYGPYRLDTFTVTPDPTGESLEREGEGEFAFPYAKVRVVHH